MVEIMKKMKKEKKKWSRKKKLVLYPIISIIVILSLLSACSAAGLLSVEHDVNNGYRKDRYLQIFTEIIKKKAGVDLAKPKDSDFSEMRENEERRADKDGYIVKMEGKAYDKAGNYYEARTEFWTPKNLKRYQVDLAKCQKKGKSEKEKQKEAAEKAKAKAEAEKKEEEKKKKEEAKKKAEAKKKEKEEETTEQKAEDAVYDIKVDALKADFDLDDLDVEANGKVINGKEYPAVDVVLTIYRDDTDMGKLYGEKLKKIVLKHVKYGSVTVQKYKIDYQWDNYN